MEHVNLTDLLTIYYILNVKKEDKYKIKKIEMIKEEFKIEIYIFTIVT